MWGSSQDAGQQLNGVRFAATERRYTMPEMTKAKIEVLDRNGNKAGEDIEVLFNPNQYVLSESPKYNTIVSDKSDTPIVEYAGGNNSTLSMELFLDTGPVLTASGEGNKDATDVSVKVKEFESLIYINGQIHTPPIVRFVWGSLSFQGVVTELKSTFTKFMEDGKPIQAKLSISLMSYSGPEGGDRASPFESPDRTKCRTVREDYSIWDMAKSEYGDVSKWKVIARANNISNPLEIPPGTIVKIPAL